MAYRSPAATKDGLSSLHPVRTELVVIATRLFERATEAAMNVVANGPEAEQTFRDLAKQFLEVTTWIYGNLPPPSEEALVGELQQHLAEGWSSSTALKWADVGRRRQRGRPVTLRPVAVQAAELRLADPSLSWPKVARQVCANTDCPHGRQCYERIRREVIALQALLKRHGSALVIARPA